MPQLELQTFVVQVTWFSIVFLSLFIFFLGFFLPSLLEIFFYYNFLFDFFFFVFFLQNCIFLCYIFNNNQFKSFVGFSESFLFYFVRFVCFRLR